MFKLLNWLDGKKSIILGCIGAVSSYLVAVQVITPDLGVLVTTISALLGGTAIVASDKILGTRYRAK